MTTYPSDWKVVKLGEIVDVLDSRRVPLNGSQRCRGVYPYCGANGIVDYIDKYEFDEEVILIAEDGGNFEEYVSRPIAYQMKGKFWVNNHAHVLKAKEGVSQDYVFRQLEHKDITDVISGGTRAKLTRSQLDGLEIPLPSSLPEQKRIAGVLGDMDKLIENLGKRIEKKRQIKKGAMQELLTGKKRLSGFTGEWVERKIRKMLTIGHGRDYKHLANGTTPVYGSGGLMCYVDGWLHDGETVCIGRKGTIDEPMYHNGKIWTVDTLFYTHSFEDAVPKFLYYKFLMVDWLSHNAASGVPSLTSKTIEEIELLMPPSVNEQRAIAAVLGDMDAEIANLERRQEKLKQVKKGMLQDLLTGKVRLKGQGGAT